MLFKNLSVFRITSDIDLSDECLSAALPDHVHTAPGPSVLASCGWSPIFEGITDSTLLFHRADGYILLSLKIEERILPAAAINNRLQAKIAAIKEKEQRKISSHERREIKEQIVTNMLPNAFTKATIVRGYIDTRRKLLVVDSASAAKTDHFTSTLRKSLGSLPLSRLIPNISPGHLMSKWLQDIEQLPGGFTVADECVLRSNGAGGEIIAIKGMDSHCDEVLNHLQHGKLVAKLLLSCEDRILFHLTDDLLIKRIKFSDVINENLNEHSDDAAQKFDSDFVLSANELSSLIMRLAEIFECNKQPSELMDN